MPPSLAAPGPGVLTHLLLLPASKQPKRDTCRRTGSGSSRLARSLESRSWLGIRVPRPKARPWRGALSWERDTGRLHGSCSDQSRPDSEALPGTRSLRLDSQPTRPSRQSRSPDGTRSRGHGDSAVSQSTHSAEPTVTLSGPAGQANRSAAVPRAAQGYGARETGTRRPASSPTRLSLAAALKAPQARRAVGTAAVRSGPWPPSRRSLDRENFCPADSWSFQPGMTASRDSNHHAESRPQRAA